MVHQALKACEKYTGEREVQTTSAQGSWACVDTDRAKGREERMRTPACAWGAEREGKKGRYGVPTCKMLSFERALHCSSDTISALHDSPGTMTRVPATRAVGRVRTLLPFFQQPESQPHLQRSLLCGRGERHSVESLCPCVCDSSRSVQYCLQRHPCFRARASRSVFFLCFFFWGVPSIHQR